MSSTRRAIAGCVLTLAGCASRSAPQIAQPQAVEVHPTTADAGVVSDDGGLEPEPSRVITIDEFACGPDVVSFAPNEITIGPDGAKTIAKEAEAWRDAAAQTVVEIAAFSAPDEKDALGLSQRRAAAVAEALVVAGVDRRILRPVGYGAYCAMAPDVSAKDPQRRNRFAYLVMIATSSGPTDARPGCDASRKAGIGLKP